MFFGGAERYLIELSRVIKGIGYATNIYQCANSKWVRYYRDIKVTGLETGYDYNRLNKEFHLVAPQGVLTIYFAFHLAFPVAHQPSIGISHGVYWDDVEFQYSPYYARYGLKEILIAISNLSAFVSVDTNTLNWVRSTYANVLKNAFYIPNFVDLQQFQVRNRQPMDRVVIVYPRRLNRVRGFWLMYQLVPDILQRFDNVDFHFVGRADIREEQAVNRLVRQFPTRVKWYFLPPERMHEAYEQSDIVVIPTIASEGTSLSCLEGMASGCAVVATTVGGLPNLILPDYNGLLVEPTADALQDALIRLIENSTLRADLAQRAIQVAKFFDIQIWRLRWKNLLMKYLPMRQPIVQQPQTAVFYPAKMELWQSATTYYLRRLAEYLADQGVDVFWVQSSRSESDHLRVHLLAEGDDLYLTNPLVFFDNRVQPLLNTFENPASIFCYVVELFPEALENCCGIKVNFYISDNQEICLTRDNIIYLPAPHLLSTLVPGLF